MRLSLATVAAASAVALACAQAPSPWPTDCQGVENPLPVYKGAAQFVAKAANGSRWVVSAPGVNPPLMVLHVYGTAYEMGYAYGELAQEEIIGLVTDSKAWIADQVNSSLPALPANVRAWIETQGVQDALELTLLATTPHIPDHFFQLAYGMGNATGLGWLEVMKLALLPELIKASCSMIGAWGAALPAADAPELIVLRALDWSTDGPFQQYPLALTFHPTDGGNAFTTLGWAGFLGALTGMSSSGVAITEKVWLHYTGEDSIFGYPFTFVLQDILQFDVDIDSGLSRVATANRTCSIFNGIGQASPVPPATLPAGVTHAPPPRFVINEYAYQSLTTLTPYNFPYYPPYHTYFQDLVYVNKHTQPSLDYCMNDLVAAMHGNVTVDAIVHTVAPVEATGDTHAAVYSFNGPASTMTVTNAGVYDPATGTAVPGYARQWMELPVGEYWALTLADAEAAEAEARATVAVA